MEGMIIPIFNSFNHPCVLIWNNKTQAYVYFGATGDWLNRHVDKNRVRSMFEQLAWKLREE